MVGFTLYICGQIQYLVFLVSFIYLTNLPFILILEAARIENDGRAQR